jgi:hypothetical protein
MEIKAIQSRIQEIESRSPDAEQAEQRDLALMIKLA